MTARDSIQKLFQILSSSGIPKEPLHILETKLTSLEEQVITLENEIKRLKSENEQLKVHLKCLEPQTEEISKDTIGILKLLFERAGDISADDISATFKWKQEVVDYHLDVLLKKRFIRESSLGMRTAFGSSLQTYGLTTLGRRYILQFADI